MHAVDKQDLIQGKTGWWELVIGLEVHAQVFSQAKLFSGAATTFGAAENTQVAYVDAGFPGMLPVVNAFCIEQAIKTGLGMNSQINLISFFDRKNYFYPDLPQGYQISQFFTPIVQGGYIEIEKANGTSKKINVNRLHLEQDAGKSIHQDQANQSLIDLNRSGVALMEIVSEPDINSIEEVQLYLKNLRALLRCLKTCDGNMEQGSLRVDVNISLHQKGTPLGTRTEIKNVNSIRYIGQAIDYEVKRQLKLLESGEKIIQETRLFDSVSGVTRTMRSKEEAHDYRYFPDPDLPAVVVTEELIKTIKENLPILPKQKKEMFIKEFGLSSYDSEIIVSDTDISIFFTQAVTELKKINKVIQKQDIKILTSWIIVELFSLLNKQNVSIEKSKVSAVGIAELVSAILLGTISGKIAKNVLIQMWDTGKTGKQIIAEQGLEQISDLTVIEKNIDIIITNNMDKVTEYRNGKEKLFGYFIGQIMKLTQGKANPTKVNELLKNKLNKN